MSGEPIRGRLLLWATAFAAAATLGLPASRPALAGAAPLVGPAVGLALFAALAGRPRRPRRAGRATGIRAVYLALSAVFEELLWRGVALAALVPRVGMPAALAATTVGFALAHGPAVGRRCAVHLLTGAGFGAAFVAAGLAAAILAHAAYNVLVDLAVQAERERAP